MSPAVDFGIVAHAPMLSALMAGEIGTFQGATWREGVAIEVPWRWWSPRAWAHQYRWPGGSDAWFPYVDVDALEDPPYDRLYDTPWEPPVDPIVRWAERLWAELPREIYFNRFMGVEGSNSRVSSAIAAIRRPWWRRAWRRFWLQEEREAMWRAKFWRDYPLPDDDRGDTITFSRIQNLEAPPDAQSPPRKRRRPDRPKPLRARGPARKRPGL